MNEPKIDPNLTTRITPVQTALFDALRDPSLGSEFALLAVNLDGEPTVAIIHVQKDAQGMVKMTPLYVAVTPAILERLLDPWGEPPVAQ